MKDKNAGKSRRTIRSIPRGKVSTYGAVAKAAGFPGAARQVVAALRDAVGLPWQRVLAPEAPSNCAETTHSNSVSGWRQESPSEAARST